MRYFLCLLLIFFMAFPTWADEPAKPNALTPKEVEDGWISLFDGKTTFGWKVDGNAKAADEGLRLGGGKETTADFSTTFGSFELRYDYRVEGTAEAALSLKGPKGYFMGNRLVPTKEEGWSRSIVKAQQDAAKNSFSVYYEGFAPSGEQTSNYTVSEWSPRSPIRMGFKAPADSTLVLRNIKIQPLDLKPIFNGKDLTGWKEIKTNRTKSQFTVTPEGWIHLKNGPGDLQTEGQWGDFVLQLDCRSNGKHLNSGVFFRCQPNKYQQGYEAQIHNGFFPDPAKPYTLKEYDPKTHKLSGEKKVKYAAMDYGTGAIYNRQPARFQVAKDHEWFTMTIVAEGNHFAVWVNGIEVTDWTDNRPPSDNARNGFRKEKGPISLQGHDPTTDLDFRNIRIAALPRSAGNPKLPNEKK